jgi:hypothetical protein
MLGVKFGFFTSEFFWSQGISGTRVAPTSIPHLEVSQGRVIVKGEHPNFARRQENGDFIRD